MGTPPITDAELNRTLRLMAEHNNDRMVVATHLGIAYASVASRLKEAQRRGLIVEIPQLAELAGLRAVKDEDYQACVDAYQLHGQFRSAAKSLGLHESTFKQRVNKAWDAGYVARMGGRVDARKATVRALPEKGTIKRYVLTCAQSETLLHEPTWNTLKTVAKHYDAELLVATYSYKHRQEGSAKRDSAKGSKAREDWYDDRALEHVADEMIQLAPSLIWNGHVNILPTAVDPLSGVDNYNGRASSIFPHAKLAMKSIPTVRRDPAKLQYTTGTATLRNYLQKKAGQKAEFDHVYGGLLVEVDATGSWWVRQLISDAQGVCYDLDLKFLPTGSVERNDSVEAVVWGDIHVAQLENDQKEVCWGENGIMQALKPKRQYMHDIIDFESRSHHNRKDPFKAFELHVKKRESVSDEVFDVWKFLVENAGTCQTYVVQSNHDRHLERWLKEADWRTDPVNAEFYTACTAAYLKAVRAGESFNALEWAVTRLGKLPKVKWLDADESHVICKDASGGVEMGLHGDLGPNGARGSIRNLARLGRKVCIGHSHSAGIFNGAWQTGVTAKLGMDYAKGAPSSWSHSHILVHANGKRQMVTVFNGKWRA